MSTEGERQYTGIKGPENEIFMAGSADSDTKQEGHHPYEKRREDVSENPLEEARKQVEATKSSSPLEAPSKITKGMMPVEADTHHGRPRQPDQTYSGQYFQERADRGISQGRPEEWEAAQQGQYDPKTKLAPRK